MVRAFLFVFSLLCFEANAAVGSISLHPPAGTVAVGETFSVDVVGEFDTDVLGGGLTLQINSQSALEVKDPVFNPAWDLIQMWDPATLTAQFSAGGTPGAPLPSGKFTILTFEFLAHTNGVYSLGLIEYTGNPFTGSSSPTNTFPITVTFDQTNVPAQITAVPEPAAAWTLLVGLAFALMRIRRA